MKTKTTNTFGEDYHSLTHQSQDLSTTTSNNMNFLPFNVLAVVPSTTTPFHFDHAIIRSVINAYGVIYRQGMVSRLLENVPFVSARLN